MKTENGKKTTSRKTHKPKSANEEDFLHPLKNTVASEKQIGIQGSTKGFENKRGKEGRTGYEGRQ